MGAGYLPAAQGWGELGAWLVVLQKKWLQPCPGTGVHGDSSLALGGFSCFKTVDRRQRMDMGARHPGCAQPGETPAAVGVGGGREVLWVRPGIGSLGIGQASSWAWLVLVSQLCTSGPPRGATAHLAEHL